MVKKGCLWLIINSNNNEMMHFICIIRYKISSNLKTYLPENSVDD